MSLVLFLDVWCAVPGFGTSVNLKDSEPHGRLLRNTTDEESHHLSASVQNNMETNISTHTPP